MNTSLMNNKIIVIVVAFIVAALVAWWWVQMSAPEMPAPSAETAAAVYSDGVTTVEATFDNAAGAVTFTHPDVGTVTLPQAVSASGARYANEDESIVFWEHQDEATITKDGAEIFRGAIQRDKAGAAAASRTADIDDVAGVWVWERTTLSDGSVVAPAEPESFVIAFSDDGIIVGNTDCNDFAGTYQVIKEGFIVISAGAIEKTTCAESQEADFIVALVSASHIDVSQSDKLIMTVNEGQNTMYLKKI